MAVAIINCPHCGREMVVKVATTKDTDKFSVVVDEGKSKEQDKLPRFRGFPIAE